MNNLSIISVNVQKNNNTLNGVLNYFNANIICIQECSDRKNNFGLLTHPQYSMYSVRSINPSYTKVRTTIYVNNDFNGKNDVVILEPYTNGDIVYIMVNKSLIISNVYRAPNNNIVLPTVIQSLLPIISNKKHIMVGDFNLHHKAWQSTIKRNDPIATKLIDQLILHRYQYIGQTNVPTHLKGNTLDLVFASTNTISSAIVQKTPQSVGSDHLAILITMKCNSSTHTTLGKPMYNYEKANWTAIYDKIENYSLPKSFQKQKQLEIFTKDFQTFLANLQSRFVPKYKIVTRTKRWWDSKLSETYKQLLQTSNDLKTCPCIPHEQKYKQMKSKFSQMSQNKKIDFRNRYIIPIDKDNIWKLLKHSQPRTLSPELNKSFEEKCEFFANQYCKNHQSHIIQLNYNNTEIPLINESEIYYAIGKPKPNKACGPDGIEIKFLQYIKDCEPFIQILSSIFNGITLFNHISNCLKTLTMVFISKPHKIDYQIPKAYRPISLLNHLAKVFELLKRVHN